MPRTLIKSRLHSKNENIKLNKKYIVLNQHYLHIFNHLNKNYCQEMVLLYINELRRFSVTR